MNLSCLSNIVNNCLILNIDIANPKSWNGNSGFTVSNLSSYCDAITTTKESCDWGLTQYDIGAASALTESHTLDKTFHMYETAYNDASGNTFAFGNIADSFDANAGSYFTLDGGYLQNFFKLYGYSYELLPTRFNNGFTFETWVKINDNTFSSITGDTDGIFLYLGARAENKFGSLITGNTVYHSGASAYTTCTGATFIADHTDNLELGVDNNVLAFKFNSDGSLGYKYIDDKFNSLTCKSNKIITTTGWTQITITFTPDELIRNFDAIKDCAPLRNGTLGFYVNGRKFWTVNKFTEFSFKPMDTSPDKQVGVPYNISWGGGSFGLKYSWNYNNDEPYYINNPSNNNLLIEENYNGSFIGGIQILRMHACALDFTEVKHNFKIDNQRFGLNINFGGRMIYL